MPVTTHPPLRVAIFDYGAGNLHSLEKALGSPGVATFIETDPREAIRGDALVLPGVGAFGTAASALAGHRAAMRDAILAGLPTLGICLGMQMLFDGSDEGSGRGLGVLRGRVTRVDADRLPHIGWNAIEEPRDGLLERVGLHEAYFANSYACRPASPEVVTAWSTHGRDRFPAAVRAGHVTGVQFHPEKSSAPGVAFVRAFLEQVRGAARRVMGEDR